LFLPRCRSVFAKTRRATLPRTRACPAARFRADRGRDPKATHFPRTECLLISRGKSCHDARPSPGLPGLLFLLTACCFVIRQHSAVCSAVFRYSNLMVFLGARGRIHRQPQPQTIRATPFFAGSCSCQHICTGRGWAIPLCRRSSPSKNNKPCEEVDSSHGVCFSARRRHGDQTVFIGRPLVQGWAECCSLVHHRLAGRSSVRRGCRCCRSRRARPAGCTRSWWRRGCG
jgi:hypothetical protein